MTEETEPEPEKPAAEPEPVVAAEKGPAVETAAPAALAKAESESPRDYRALGRYFAILDFGAWPTSKAGWAVRFGVTLVALVILSRRLTTATATLLTARVPPAIPTEEIDDYRFRLPERTRKDIFADLAAAELSERHRAITTNSWNGHAWSREDDRGHYERVAARAAAAKYRVSLSQVYLVLDEGIREHWLAPDGNPLPATTPPLSIRSNSW